MFKRKHVFTSRHDTQFSSDNPVLLEQPKYAIISSFVEIGVFAEITTQLNKKYALCERRVL